MAKVQYFGTGRRKNLQLPEFDYYQGVENLLLMDATLMNFSEWKH